MKHQGQTTSETISMVSFGWSLMRAPLMVSMPRVYSATACASSLNYSRGVAYIRVSGILSAHQHTQESNGRWPQQ
jgi:hypothetical protein